uniref:Uncharacterized protein n=1 Tax=Heterosigma akashiwo TaxID=2829 RepID=A0A7S3XKB9_HETAK
MEENTEESDYNNFTEFSDRVAAKRNQEVEVDIDALVSLALGDLEEDYALTHEGTTAPGHDRTILEEGSSSNIQRDCEAEERKPVAFQQKSKEVANKESSLSSIGANNGKDKANTDCTMIPLKDLKKQESKLFASPSQQLREQQDSFQKDSIGRGPVEPLGEERVFQVQQIMAKMPIPDSAVPEWAKGLDWDKEDGNIRNILANLLQQQQEDFSK